MKWRIIVKSVKFDQTAHAPPLVHLFQTDIFMLILILKKFVILKKRDEATFAYINSLEKYLFVNKLFK